MSSNLQNAPVLTSGAAASVSPPLYTQFVLLVFFCCSFFHDMDSKSNNSFNKDFAVLNKMASLLSNVHLTSMINADV